MEGALNKTGLYEFLGGFIPGMVAVVAWVFFDFPSVVIEKADSELKVTFFLVESYFFGMDFQEIGSWLDEKIFHVRERWKMVSLNDNAGVASNEQELSVYRAMANEILNKPDKTNVVFTPEEQRTVFNYCKNYLEAEGKNQKEHMHDSLYSMNRSLLVVFMLLLALYLCSCLKNITFSHIDIVRVLALIPMICILYRRTKKYSRLRTHAVLQHYEALHRVHLKQTASVQM